MKSFKLTELPAVYKSFDEDHADDFYLEWQKIFPDIQRVHGVVGMANSGRVACETARGEYFVLIDGDAFPLPRAIENAVIELPEDQTWHKFQSIQGVTKTQTPHGALAIFHRERGIELCTNAVRGTVHCNFQPGFVVIDTVPLSIEFTNQSANIAFRAAYKDCSLFLQSGLNPVTYLPCQDLAKLTGKRQRIMPWLTNGADEPWGLYSLYGAHRAVYDVFSGRSAHAALQDIEMFKMVSHALPKLDTYQDLMEIIAPYYRELGINMPVPRPPDIYRTDLLARCCELQQQFDQ